MEVCMKSSDVAAAAGYGALHPERGMWGTSKRWWDDAGGYVGPDFVNDAGHVAAYVLPVMFARGWGMVATVKGTECFEGEESAVGQRVVCDLLWWRAVCMAVLETATQRRGGFCP